MIIANWKMNPMTEKEAKDILNVLKRKIIKIFGAETFVCPPALYFATLKKSYSGKKISFGLQDVFYEERGSYTGEISVEQAKDFGAKLVIVGHSERRALGETNDIVSKKLKAVLKNNIKAVLCVGERERDEHGEYLLFLREEIRASLSGIQKSMIDNLIIAYEPIWAIGKNYKMSISARELEEVIIFIKKVLSEIYGKDEVQMVPIIYGGSVEEKNAEELAGVPLVDGFLVGHESLKPNSFITIALALSSRKK